MELVDDGVEVTVALETMGILDEFSKAVTSPGGNRYVCELFFDSYLLHTDIDTHIGKYLIGGDGCSRSRLLKTLLP